MKTFLKTILIISCLMILPTAIFAANTTGSAWSENAGWANFNSTNGGVTVSTAGLTGYLWLENVGWIQLDYDGTAGATNTTSTNWGVVNDGLGNLSGYGWGESIGWINFQPTDSQVTIDTSGNFSGYAWSENIGWIKFDHAQTNDKPTTTWRRDAVVTTSSSSTLPSSNTSTSPVTSIRLEGGTYDPKTKIRTINISQDGTLRLNVILPDPDQLRKATILINKKTYTLKRETRNGKVIFSVILTDFRHKIGKYPYTLFADYGNTQVKEKGIISIEAKNNSVLIQDVNQNFREVYKRTPTFTEWLKWTKEVLAGITKEQLQIKLDAGR